MTRLTDTQYLSALERLRARIESGVEIRYVDSTCIGDKYTEVSWGMCCADESMWPLDTRSRPDAPLRHRHGDPEPVVYHLKDRTQGQLCPFDEQKPPKGVVFTAGYPNGCFRRCKVFRGSHIPGKEESLALYDEMIRSIHEK